MTGKHVTFDVDLGDTVDKLKMKIEDKEGTPVDQQRLVFNNKVLENDRTLSSYGIQREYMINLSLYVRGGGGDGKMIQYILMFYIIAFVYINLQTLFAVLLYQPYQTHLEMKSRPTMVPMTDLWVLKVVMLMIRPLFGNGRE